MSELSTFWEDAVRQLRAENDALKDSLVAARWIDAMYAGPPDKGNMAAVLTEMHTTLRGMLAQQWEDERKAIQGVVETVGAENAKLREALQIAGVWERPMERIKENERLREAFEKAEPNPKWSEDKRYGYRLCKGELRVAILNKNTQPEEPTDR